jgi:hypothetical protein
MSNSAKISLRGLFAATAIAAMFTASLAVPSVGGWITPMAFLALCIACYGIQRFITSPPTRTFWWSYLGGVIVLFFMRIWLYVGHQSPGITDFYRVFLAYPVWERFHGVVPDELTYDYRQFQAFSFCLQVISLVLLPAVAAFAMTFFSRERNAQ